MTLEIGNLKLTTMTVFCYKKITAPVRLGDIFKTAREARNLTIKEIAERLQIQSRYLQALEDSAFSKLPKAKVFRLAYVREYAKELGLPTDSAVEKFLAEAGLENTKVAHPRRAIKIWPFASVSIFIRNLVVITGAILFVVYLGWQVHGVLQPPRLTVYSPLDGYVSNQPSAMVQGETDRETQLTVNGQDIMVNQQGRFETKVDLTTGLNTLTISATKKHGKTTTIVRHLVVQQLGRVSLK